MTGDPAYADTTLIDFASDLRAPTPTGAAEKAVPVRAELVERIEVLEGRIGAVRVEQSGPAEVPVARSVVEGIMSSVPQNLGSCGIC